MGELKTCVNDHLYDENLDTCPHCLTNDSTEDTILEDKTELDTSQDNHDTVNDQTAVAVDVEVDEKTAIHNVEPDTDRTVIHQQGTEPKTSSPSPTHGRKLVGWLVSFTWDKEGQDYQLREGKTLIGAKEHCDITINDNEISGTHATILFRKDTFRIRDEMSSNGTKINDDVDLMGEQSDLNDGDKIKIGKTELTFRRV